METFTTDRPLTINNVTLIPVVHHCLHADNNKSAYWLAANKEPLAIIVCDRKGVHAFDMMSSEISVTSLEQKIPELKSILTPYRRHDDDQDELI